MNMGIGEKNKITLTRKKSKIDMWFLDKDKWFIEVRKGNQEFMIIEKDLEEFLDYYARQGYLHQN
jgi:hypothetical protein